MKGILISHATQSPTFKTIDMTAVVGILNKQAVAIAADSAVTIDGNNGRKIFKKANKVFTLSKYHPVGILIHNSASFMTTPWETIIKLYRRQLEEHSFATVREYRRTLSNFCIAKTALRPLKCNKYSCRTLLEWSLPR